MGLRITMQPRESLTVATSIVEFAGTHDARVSLTAARSGEVVEIHSQIPDELRMIAREFAHAADSLERAQDGH